MISTLFAIGGWLFIAVPLMIIIPAIMIIIVRQIAWAFGDDSFRLRVRSVKPETKKRIVEWDDEI